MMSSPEPAQHARTLVRLRKLSHLLDNAVRIPGTQYRMGLDPLLGLIPGGGDLVGGLLSTYIVLEAARVGAPRAMLRRMTANILVEVGVGVVPLMGDLFDVTWKANARNFALLEQHLEVADSAAAGHPWAPAGLFLGLLLTIGAVTWLSIRLLRWILEGIASTVI